jgi:ubiquinol-cytochrome c reductase cytochrome b subunit
MRILKSHPLLKLANSYLIDSPQPSNLSYLWNFGSLLAFCLIIQIITGITLAMHYNPSVLEAFNSVEHIMRDVNNGWLIRYLHSNTASAFFFIVYLHIGRGLYYGSYKAPRTLVWTIGTIIFILMIATAFLGYVLPYGQMSLWGATVITNLMSAIPWIGQDIVEFLWGGFSVNNATLNRFFSLHFVLPFVLAALALMHLIALHDSAGSGNPVGVSGNYDRLPFAPYFIFKDLVTIFLFILVLSIFVFFVPNVLGDTENYVMANPMQTPPAIVPEWYLLPFYAILRSIPNKLLGVIAMFSAILILLTMPFTDLSRSRGIQFRPLTKVVFYVFIWNFLILLQLGAKHVESPFIEFGQVSTVLYFIHFLFIIPFLSLLENSLIELPENPQENTEYNNLTTPLTTDVSSILYIVNTTDLVSPESIFKELYAVIVGLCTKILPFINWLTWGVICDWSLRSQMATASSVLTGLMMLSSIKRNIGLFPVIFLYFLIPFMAHFIMDLEFNDTPRPWGLYFQDSATPQMEGLVELHDTIMFYLAIILFIVGWMLLSLVKTFNQNVSPISYKYTNHGTLIELIWTITPALILILIAFPSFKLLYLMDEINDPSMSVLAEGHQWYWSYQYPDFLNSDLEFIELDSYLVPESDLEEGSLRMLEVDNRVIIPELTHVRFLVTAADVIHSFACPSLGIKCDAYPGRLNQMSVLINREGTFYGQCSEICGILHSSMPIVIESVSIEKFLNWLEEQ